MTLHLGLDISNAMDPRPSGVSRYITCLLDALQKLPDAPEITLLCRPSRRRHGNPQEQFAGHRFAWLTPFGVPRNLDVIHAPDVRMPARSRVPVVVTIHDLSSLERQDHASPRFRKRKIEGYERAAREATAIITHTRAIAGGISTELGVDPERVHPVHLASALPMLESGPVERRTNQLLIVGGPSRRKGAHRVVALIDDLDELGWRPQFTWVGSASQAQIDEYRRTLPATVKQRIDFRGHVTDEELDGLYRQSTALLVPSESEGFCMPLLEAAERRCPVLAVESMPMREVLGSGALWLPREGANHETLTRFLDEKTRQQTVESAERRAREFDWARTAERTLTVYSEARNQRRG